MYGRIAMKQEAVLLKRIYIQWGTVKKTINEQLGLSMPNYGK